jgi:hypothetical protein
MASWHTGVLKKDIDHPSIIPTRQYFYDNHPKNASK